MSVDVGAPWTAPGQSISRFGWSVDGRGADEHEVGVDPEVVRIRHAR
jgi:hypothetical protein